MQEQQLNDISKQWLSALDTAAANSQQKNNTIKNDSEIKYSKDNDLSVKEQLKKYADKLILDKIVKEINTSDYNVNFDNKKAVRIPEGTKVPISLCVTILLLKNCTTKRHVCQ